MSLSLCIFIQNFQAIREIIDRDRRSYEETVELVEHLKACADVATNRVANWQRYCVNDPAVLEFFFLHIIGLDEPIAHCILNLILAAVLEVSFVLSHGRGLLHYFPSKIHIFLTV